MCMYVCMYVCMFVCLLVCLFVCLFVCLHACAMRGDEMQTLFHHAYSGTEHQYWRI